MADGLNRSDYLAAKLIGDIKKHLGSIELENGWYVVKDSVDGDIRFKLCGSVFRILTAAPYDIFTYSPSLAALVNEHLRTISDNKFVDTFNSICNALDEIIDEQIRIGNRHVFIITNDDPRGIEDHIRIESSKWIFRIHDNVRAGEMVGETLRGVNKHYTVIDGDDGSEYNMSIQSSEHSHDAWDKKALVMDQIIADKISAIFELRIIGD